MISDFRDFRTSNNKSKTEEMKIKAKAEEDRTITEKRMKVMTGITMALVDADRITEMNRIPKKWREQER